MKKLVSSVILALILFGFSWVSPAFAGDAGNGSKVFSANCNACHLGGKNVVNAAKTLNKSDLEKYAMLDLEAIKTQVTNGKGAMPAFGKRLTPDQIEDVATYVLEKAEKGW
ncbi:cytochrome c class I [Gloeothece citriformis PCC 7424]|uniref:Cytochrome c6 n=1 Tax=Gloeothece citriformis (strain PCC 7424) TaxID=65393 RepID=CYC6_GLOC7|nr:c-type cytochrome [Gloeothece citriformis]B7K722.1 RecName: Full=Cytochrome c6; AltName: Full=Cytochrome c-553; AltName: Full=Cytochrome c553; AltName: Full=Soluble cytochrome f; Flags: Precursor [Gloeothece citriformis PCC 7424]ACK72721.1 cytochrome c class I [Gloeothece citriformis PCC 7424]